MKINFHFSKIFSFFQFLDSLKEVVIRLFKASSLFVKNSNTVIGDKQDNPERLGHRHHLLFERRVQIGLLLRLG